MSLIIKELLLIGNDDREAIEDQRDDKCSEVLGKWIDYVTNGQYESVLESALAREILGTEQVVAEETNILSLVVGNVERYSQSRDEASASQDHACLLCLAASCLQLFVQNNWVGPPTKRDPYEFLPAVLRDKDKRESLDAYVLNSLSVDGESVYRLSSYPLYLLLARILLLECRAYLQHCQTSGWWLMRCLQIQQALLEERSPTLKATIQELIAQTSTKEPLATDDAYRLAMLEFHLEAGHLMYFYYEPSESKEHFSKASKLAGITVELTGALGKRTKFQEKELAQLVLKVQRKGTSSGEGAAQHNESPCLTMQTVSDSQLPKDVALDDDTVLNQIKLKDEENSRETDVLPVEQAFILGMCHQHRRSHEGTGDILQEESLAFITSILSQRKNWCVLSAGLLLRTYWECNSTRRMERSMAQLEELANQFTRPSDHLSERLKLMYAVKLPPVWEVKRELGHLLVKIGVVNAALDVYLSLQMWEDVIKCYKELGRREKAEQVIREQLAVGETPSLWCYLGDVTEDSEFYQKAWELSNGRYARAQRCMGYLHLRRGEFEECLSCFEKALALNPLQIGVWFSYGCASMAVEKYEQAVKAFRRCVVIDTDNFEAWNNLATAYIRNNQKPKAFVTLQEAIKCDYENWRIWENYMLVATDIGQFDEVMRSYHRLLDLRHKHTDTQVLGILVRVVNEDIVDAKGNPGSKHRDALLELFGRLTSMVTTEAGIWRLYGQLLVEGKQEASTTDRQRAMQYFQKSHRCLTQAPNWAKDAETCKDVLQHTITLAKTYLHTSEKTTDNTQAIQILSSAKLSLKSVLTNVKKSHTDPVTQQLLEDLVSPCNQLEAEIQTILQTIETKKGSG